MSCRLSASALALACVVLGGVASSCAKKQKPGDPGLGKARVKQCNKLSREITIQGTRVKKATARVKPDRLDEMARVAGLLKEAAGKVEGVAVEGLELKGFQRRWVRMLRSMGRKFDAFKEAARKKDGAAFAKVFKEIQNVAKEEGKIVAGLNNFCSVK